MNDLKNLYLKGKFWGFFKSKNKETASAFQKRSTFLARKPVFKDINLGVS